MEQQRIRSILGEGEEEQRIRSILADDDAEQRLIDLEGIRRQDVPPERPRRLMDLILPAMIRAASNSAIVVSGEEEDSSEASIFYSSEGSSERNAVQSPAPPDVSTQQRPLPPTPRDDSDEVVIWTPDHDDNRRRSQPIPIPERDGSERQLTSDASDDANFMPGGPPSSSDDAVPRSTSGTPWWSRAPPAPPLTLSNAVEASSQAESVPLLAADVLSREARAQEGTIADQTRTSSTTRRASETPLPPLHPSTSVSTAARVESATTLSRYPTSRRASASRTDAVSTSSGGSQTASRVPRSGRIRSSRYTSSEPVSVTITAINEMTPEQRVRSRIFSGRTAPSSAARTATATRVPIRNNSDRMASILGSTPTSAYFNRRSSVLPDVARYPSVSAYTPRVQARPPPRSSLLSGPVPSSRSTPASTQTSAARASSSARTASSSRRYSHRSRSRESERWLKKNSRNFRVNREMREKNRVYNLILDEF
jgi:hypothetical protein